MVLVAHLEREVLDRVADLRWEHARISFDTVTGHESDLISHTQENLSLQRRRLDLGVVQRPLVPVGDDRDVTLAEEQEMDHREVLARRRLDTAVTNLDVHQVWYVSEELEFWQELAEIVDEAWRTEGAEGER